MPDYYYFGVEIEVIAEPHRVRSPLLAWVYYEKLASALRFHGLEALADRCKRGYRKHTEHYDKWWITKDGSLGNPSHPKIPLEAVSPILHTGNVWETEIECFWTAWARVFHMPDKSSRCGSHIHVSPAPDKSFGLLDLTRIAFGVVFYEPLVEQLLPYNRRNNQYCELNTSHSTRLLDCYTGEDDLEDVWNEINAIYDRQEMCDFMQKIDSDPSKSRYVLWNFAHVTQNGTGTIEFRGGRGLRGPVRTKRWISFAISFIHMCTEQSFDTWDDFTRPTMAEFWQDIREAAGANAVRDHLPLNWRVMNESTSDNSYEAMGETLDSSSDSDVSSIVSKAESAYSDSECSSGEEARMVVELEQERKRLCVIL